MNRIILFLLLCGVGSAASAADLVDIYQVAKNRDPAIAAAEAQLEGQETQIGQARGVLLPQLDLSASTQWNQENIEYDSPPPVSFGSRGGDEDYNSNGYSLQLTQALFNMEAFARYDQAQSVVQQARLSFDLAQQDLILRVADAYFSVLLAQDTLQTAQAETKALLEQLNRAQRAFEVGTASAVDVDQARARFDLARAREIEARNQVAIAREQLQSIIGQPVIALADLQDDIPLERPTPSDMTAWVEQARQSNLLVLAQRAGVEIARSELDARQGDRYPTISLIAFHDRQRGNAFTGARATTTTDAIGLQLNYNLFSGGTRYYQIEEAAAQVNQSEYNLVDAMRDASLNASQSFLAVQNSISQVKALQQALASSRTALESTRVGQRVGTRTFIDVLDALQQLYTARRDLLSARYSYLINRLQLKAAVGTLDGTDLRLINTLLVPPGSDDEDQQDLGTDTAAAG